MEVTLRTDSGYLWIKCDITYILFPGTQLISRIYYGLWVIEQMSMIIVSLLFLGRSAMGYFIQVIIICV